MLSITAGNNTLATYTYGANNGKLKKLTYGNGDYEEYEYDHLDRLVKVYYNGSAQPKYSVKYDANGDIYSLYDGVNTLYYEYDSLGRLVRAYQANADGETVLAVENSFDSLGRPKGSTYVVGDKTLSYNLTYKTDSNLVSSVSMPSSAVQSAINYTYDTLDRLTSKTVSFYPIRSANETYTYKTVTSGGTTLQTPLISSIKYRTYDGTAYVEKTLSYSYDSLGNITYVSENGVSKQQFYYDSLNRLTRENNAYVGYTYIYAYDNAGNILSKTTYPYAASTSNPVDAVDTVIYTYGDASWGDLLTNYDGTAITYDAIGNPLNWRNATSLTWEGRTLTKMQLDASSSITFTYNSDGIRTQKCYRNNADGSLNTRTATLDGTKIISEQIYDSANSISTTLYYLYDEKGDVVGLQYSNVPYYFQKNVRGDVIRIVNPAGTVVVEYIYDAWGNILSVTGTLADTVGALNPFRYRSYYYDAETGLYYLQSRYYDPEVCRFLSTDNSNVLSATPMSLTDKNLYAYCDNNPIVRADDGGEFWNTIIGAVAGAVVGGITAAITGTDVTAGIVSGAVSGAISGAAVDVAILTGGASLAACAVVAGVSGIGGATSSYISQRMNGTAHNDVDWNTVAVDGAWGAVGGALSFGMADVGGATCRTLSSTLAQPAKEIVKQAADDFATTIVITGGTWLNASKLNAIKQRNMKKSKLQHRYDKEAYLRW